MGRMHYPSNWDHCIELYKKVRNPSKGKNLGATYFRLKYDNTLFKVYYGGWSKDNVADEAHLQYTIAQNNDITICTQLNYDTVDGFNVGYLYRHIEKGIHLFYPGFSKTWDRYGWMLHDDPIFTGFTLNRSTRKILTPRVDEIEQQMLGIRTEFKQRNRQLIKMLRVYNKFDAFKDADEFFTSRNATWQAKTNARKSISYENINPEDINSLAMFIAARKAFSVYGVTNATMTGHWTNHTYDYDKLIPQLLQHGALNTLAKIRDQKYKSWYNTGTPNNP